MNSNWEKIFNTLKMFLKRFFKWMMSNWKNFILIILLVFAGVFYFNYRSMESKYGNMIQEKDREISLYKNKAGELYSQNETYVTDIKNLKISNEELYEEVKKLKDNPIVVTKIKTETVIKTVSVHDTIYRSGDNFTVKFDETNKWYGLYGTSVIDPENMESNTVIDSLYFNDEVYVDLIENKKELSFVVKSNNPFCQINTINGAVISPEKSKVLKKRFEDKWCVTAGVGGTATVIDGSVKVVPGAQITIGRKIFGF